MNTENSKTNESNKFIYHFTDKLNLQTPNSKNIGLVNLSIYYTWKNIKSAYNNSKVKISAQIGMMNSILLMALIQFQKFRITLNLSSKNTKLWLKILPYKLIQTKSKTEFQNKSQLQIRIFISRDNGTIREYKKIY